MFIQASCEIGGEKALGDGATPPSGIKLLDIGKCDIVIAQRERKSQQQPSRYGKAAHRDRKRYRAVPNLTRQ